MADSMIHEPKTERNGQAFYIYFTRINGSWVDLAPYGNRLPDGPFDVRAGPKV